MKLLIIYYQLIFFLLRLFAFSGDFHLLLAWAFFFYILIRIKKTPLIRRLDSFLILALF